jgi:hypothetical protein
MIIILFQYLVIIALDFTNELFNGSAVGNYCVQKASSSPEARPRRLTVSASGNPAGGGESLDIRQLSHFVQVYDDGNLTKSAGHRHISQQGLSMSIDPLERGRVKQFIRTPRGVSPTSDGEFFYKQTKSIPNLLALCNERQGN